MSDVLVPDLKARMRRDWGKLQLFTAEPAILGEDTLQDILAGNEDPIRLLTLKPAIQKQIMELAQSNAANVEIPREAMPYIGKCGQEFQELCRDISQDFSLAAQVLFGKVSTFTEIRAGFFRAPLSPFLHGDGNVNGNNDWNLATRIGALPIWAALSADLTRVDKTDLLIAQEDIGHGGYGSREEIKKAHQRQRAILKKFRDQDILKPLELGAVYLMRNGSDDNIVEGCQHVSSQDAQAYSCFIRSRLHFPHDL